MSNVITFGKYKGKSMEWLFFHAPWYAEWMYGAAIHRDRYKFSEEAGDCFRELMRRASALKGMCRWCRVRQVTRSGITSLLAGGRDHVGFYCDECAYPEEGVPFYGALSFFVEYENIPAKTQLQVTKYIQDRYIGDGPLTQEKMEEFFHHDDNFVHATPGFFAHGRLVEASD